MGRVGTEASKNYLQINHDSCKIVKVNINLVTKTGMMNLKYNFSKKTKKRQILFTTTDKTKNKHIHTDSIIGSNELSVISQLNNNSKKNKMSYRTILHMITGLLGLNNHLDTINGSRSKMWPNCEESEETVEHFLG